MRLFALALFLTTAIGMRAARATPVTFVAKYHSQNPSANPDIFVQLTNDPEAPVLPASTLDYALTEIDAQFPKDALRPGDRALIDKFVFSATRNGDDMKSATQQVKTADAADGLILLKEADLNNSEPVENISLRLQTSYTQDFLCQAENSYRAAKGKDFTATSYDNATRLYLETLKNKIALATLGNNATLQVLIAADESGSSWDFKLPDACKDAECVRQALGDVLMQDQVGQSPSKQPPTAAQIKTFATQVTTFLQKAGQGYRQKLLGKLIAAESTSKGDKPFKIIETTGSTPVPIVYSFCLPQHTAVNWDNAAVLNITGVGAVADKQHTHDAHKLALFGLIRDRLPTFGFGSDPTIEVLPNEPRAVITEPDLSNVVVTYSAAVTIVKDPVRALRLIEQTASGERDIESEQIIDQKSSVYLRVDLGYAERESKTCGLLGRCERLFNMPGFAVQFAVKDQSNNVTQPVAAAAVGASGATANSVIAPAATLVPMGGGLRAIGNISWSTFLGSTMTPTLYVTFNGRQLALGTKPPFTIRNLGLITTFPGVSEIQGLVNDQQASNQSSSSSVPVSWAWNMRTGNVNNIAITLPWMLSYNSRDAPDLSKYFAVFAHVSLIVNASDDQTKQAGVAPSLGAGISLAQFFQFSWAIDKKGNNYLLVGASIPDLAKLSW